MSELKPCPFCGRKAITTTFIDPDDFEYMPIEVNDCDAEVTCENERCINGWYLSPKAWNTRPIEDALNARIIEVTHLYLQTKDAFNLVTEVLLKQDARIAELEAAQRWHVVADGELPEDRATILAAFKNREILTATYYKRYEGFGGVDNLWEIAGWHSGDVTHWMPLPEPPEVQE